MDSFVSTVSDGGDLRDNPEPRNNRVTSTDIQEVRFESLIDIGEIITKYHLLDVPKEESLVFIQQLTRSRDAWFVRVGDVGLIYLTDIRLDWDASFHIMFWDRSLQSDRVAAAKSVLVGAFDRFQLPRISATVAYQNVPMKRVLTDLGFVLEGVTRKGWSVDPPIDKIHYGILAEEKPWPVLPLGGE
jgi:RimJ/RimL family protein N-acetyltransferase